jgi:hypothetical protein
MTIECKYCRTKFVPGTNSRFCSVKCRFLAKVNFSSAKGGCWIWTASRHGKGYGHFKLGGRVEKAQRLAYQLFRGPIPPGEDVCHKCDTPACVNPKHLWIGSNDKNKEDRQRKTNQARGERNHARLTEADVIEIRTSKESLESLAKIKGVSESCISHAALGRSWRYLNAIILPRRRRINRWR